MARISPLLLITMSVYALCMTGCMSTQMQRLTNRHAKSLSDLYEKQILDNLATFVSDSHATPFFSIADTSTNEVGANASIGAGDGAFVFRFWEFFSASAGQEAKIALSLIPVTETNRLKLMQCAYQRALGVLPDNCLDCCQLERDWFGSSYDCANPCGVSCGWLRKSCNWKDVPKCCRSKFGYSCGVYVWVDPCRTSEFSRLVFTIVDYATGTGHSSPPKNVTLYLDSAGQIANQANHSMVVNTIVNQGDSFQDVLGALNVSSIQSSTSDTSPELSDLRRLEQTVTQISASADNPQQLEVLKSKVSSELATNANSPVIRDMVKSFRSSASQAIAENDRETIKTDSNKVLQEIRSEIKKLEDKQLLGQPAPSVLSPSQTVPLSPRTQFGPPNPTMQFGPNRLLQRQLLNAGRIDAR